MQYRHTQHSSNHHCWRELLKAPQLLLAVPLRTSYPSKQVLVLNEGESIFFYKSHKIVVWEYFKKVNKNNNRQVKNIKHSQLIQQWLLKQDFLEACHVLQKPHKSEIRSYFAVPLFKFTITFMGLDYCHTIIARDLSFPMMFEIHFDSLRL